MTLLAIAALIEGCYHYAPIGQPYGAPPSQPQIQQQANTTPAPAQNQTTPANPNQQAELSSAAVSDDCMRRIPAQAGHKAELVRCIVSGTDPIWDKSSPQSTTQRRALGNYAIQLAEREDQGEITTEEAEQLYEQFVQKNPLSTAAAPPTQ